MNHPPQTAQVIALSELHNPTSTSATPAIHAPANPLHAIRTSLEVCIGEITLSVGELMAAKEHQIFTLDRRVDEPIDLLLGGKVVARGELVAVGEQFAVRITELPAPLRP